MFKREDIGIEYKGAKLPLDYISEKLNANYASNTLIHIITSPRALTVQ